MKEMVEEEEIASVPDKRRKIEEINKKEKEMINRKKEIYIKEGISEQRNYNTQSNESIQEDSNTSDKGKKFVKKPVKKTTHVITLKPYTY